MLPESLEQAKIHFVSDLHIGDAHCDDIGIKARLDAIKADPEAFIILGGDLMDTATRNSIGDTYTQTLSPMRQIEYSVKLFEPLKDKIIAMIPGNHEERVYRLDGIDTTAIVAAELGLTEKYSETTAILFIHLGKRQRGRQGPVCYTVYITHGSGGGRKAGGKINRLIDYCQIADTDAYIVGHVHSPAVLRASFFRPDPYHNKVTQVEKIFINTAASLDFGGYADRQGYSPASKVSPVLYLSGTEKRCWTVL